MKFAYADPPFIGTAKKHYAKHPDYAGEVDHTALIERLVREYPDGWALSLHVPSLQFLLALCPADVRVMAYVKDFCPFKKGVNPAYAWEPVIVRGGRKGAFPKRATVRDWVRASVPLKKGLSGAKPPAFCYWIFDVLGAEPEDTLDDLFPGSGIVGRCWTEYQRQRAGMFAAPGSDPPPLF